MRAVGKIMKAARPAPVAMSRQYREWVKSPKTKIRRAQAKAAVRVNVELLRLYWEMGRDIAEKRMEAEYGSGFFDNLSRDLKLEFPNMEGFSVSNLKYIKRFYLFYAEMTNRHQAGDESPVAIRQRPVDDLEKLFSIPWRHHVEIFTHAKSVDEALFYVGKTAENGWSRNVLMNMMETDLYHAKGRAVTNFAAKLPAPESDLVQQTLKDRKRKKRLVAEYALKSSAQLMGVSEYKLTKLLPRHFKASLPSVKDIEAQLAEEGRHVARQSAKRKGGGKCKRRAKP